MVLIEIFTNYRIHIKMEKQGTQPEGYAFLAHANVIETTPFLSLGESGVVLHTFRASNPQKLRR